MVWNTKRKANEYQSEYRKKNPEKIKKWEKNRIRNTPEGMRKFLDWQNKRRAEHKKKIVDYKNNSKGCHICGYKEHPEILQFHHKSKKDKSFPLSGGNIASRSWRRIFKEIMKCELLCPNCHMWKHYQESGLLGIKMSK